MSVSKAALITACSSGIGWATAERLSNVGWRVYTTARNVERIAPLEEIGCTLIPLDVSCRGCGGRGTAGSSTSPPWAES